MYRPVTRTLMVAVKPKYTDSQTTAVSLPQGKKVLLVLPEVFEVTGGIQMFCRALCLAMGRWAEGNGATVSAFALNDSVAPDNRYVNSSFAYFVGAGKSKAMFIQHFLRHVLGSHYDLIIFGHVALSPLAIFCEVFKPRAKIGIVTYGIEVWKPLAKLQRRALRQAEVVLAISEYTKDELIKHNAIPAEKIKLLPCTLDPYWQMASTLTQSEHSPPMILSVTRMSKDDRYKGIDNVIKSIPDVVREVGPVEYRVIGRGTDVPRLQALAAGLGVSRYVNFMGGLSDAELRDQYQHCSLFVMPSKKEGFGIVFLEAMAYGKAVIGGAHGGTPSVVKDGETGLLVDSSNVPDITHSIVNLLRDKKLREKFGEAGRRRLLSDFTFEKFEHNLDEVLRPLL